MYSRLIEGGERFFGVSGLLYRSNVLMYDRQSESLWSQVKRRAVTGPATGTALRVLPSTLTSWQKWRTQHPGTEVLSPRTGYQRDYSQDPYLDYYEKQSGIFSFFKMGPGEKEKELVVGLELDGQVKAYPLELLRRRGRLPDRLAGQNILLRYDSKSDRLRVTDGQGEELSQMIVYWFVWKGIWPETERYQD